MRTLLTLSFFKKTFATLAGLALGVALFFGAYSGVPTLLALNETDGADTTTPAPINEVTSPQNPTDQKCSEAMRPFAQSEQQKLVEFMNTHLKNAAPNSYLLPVALARLREYRSTLFAKRNSFSIAKTQEEHLAETAYCDQLIEDELDIAETLFSDYVTKTASSKQSTALSQKLSGINGKLRTLQTLLSQLDGSFTSFSNKLPSFTQACLKK